MHTKSCKSNNKRLNKLLIDINELELAIKTYLFPKKSLVLFPNKIAC